VMQDYLAIASPCAGGLFSRTTHDRAVRLGRRDTIRPGIECEIAVRLGRDLDATMAADPGAAAASIDCFFAAIEIVDDRYESWQTIGTPTLIADDFFAAGAVLGPAVAASTVGDPAALEGQTIIDGRVVGEGLGRDILGHPHAALAWLADHLARRGRSLMAGEFVLLGSLVRTMWLEPGAKARIAIDGLGEAALEVDA
jgi:2-keto-4-pentenoate hydratase